MKAETAWEACRTLHLPALSHQADAMAVESVLEEARGVINYQIYPHKGRLRVLYNATITSFAELTVLLENIGFPTQDNWWSRFRYSWYAYLDENARSNAKAPTPPCCNKPPK